MKHSSATPQGTAGSITESKVNIPADSIALEGELVVPKRAEGLVLFAHGSGSSRHSPRNRLVAAEIQAQGIATLLFDLLTPAEEAQDVRNGLLRFDLELLSRRLQAATHWVQQHGDLQRLGLGFFGASTGGAAALIAAANFGTAIGAVVCRGGRPDLAGAALARVTSPTLFIVGENDEMVLSLNRAAFAQLTCPRQLVVVPGATHLFEEPGALEEVARLAAGWFRQHLRRLEPRP